MINPEAYRLGAAPSAIREIFEYGRKQARLLGEENVRVTYRMPGVKRY